MENGEDEWLVERRGGCPVWLRCIYRRRQVSPPIVDEVVRACRNIKVG